MRSSVVILHCTTINVFFYPDSWRSKSERQRVMTELHGFYKNSRKPGYLKVEKDGEATWREGGRENQEDKFEYGDFKPAEKEMREASGIENYNFKLMTLNEKDGKVIHCEFGIVNSDGEKVYCLDDMGTGVEVLTKITEDQAAELGGWYLLFRVGTETTQRIFLVQTRTMETLYQPPQVLSSSSQRFGANCSG